MAIYKNLPKFNDNSYAHFITTNTYNKYPYFKDEALCKIIVEELEFYGQKYGFSLLGYVIMPDHLHLLIWWDKEEKPDLIVSKIMQGIKGLTARRIVESIHSRGLYQMLQPAPANSQELQLADTWLERMLQPTRRNTRTKSHRRSLKYRVWQPGFYDYNIHSEEKLLEKLNYMHNNPVKTGLVSSPEHYK